MSPEEMIAHCDKQMGLTGEEAQVGFVIPGRWGKTNKRRMFPGGPMGEIVNDFGNGTIYVFFSAQEVKNSIQKMEGELK